MGWRKAAVLAVSLLGGCTSTKQFADIGFQPPEGSYRLIVMRPDVSVGLLTAGGTVEPRADWTDAARDNLVRSLTRQQAGRGGTVKVASTLTDAGADPALVADLDHLNSAVGDSIKLHKYLGATLPTKKGRFDWTLGEQAVSFGQASGYDYALFLHAEDSFSSTGRVALQAVGLMGCIVGACIMPHGGRQVAFASLVDLHTGKVVWFNALSSGAGDLRKQEGADKMVEGLLDRMKPGTAARAAHTAA